MNIKKLLVIGGDKRQLYMAQSLMHKGFGVELYGFSDPAELEMLNYEN